LESIASVDHDLGQFVASGQLYALSSGGDLPAIDLRRVSEEVQAAAASADLVVLEGTLSACMWNRTYVVGITVQVDAWCYYEAQVASDL